RARAASDSNTLAWALYESGMFVWLENKDTEQTLPYYEACLPLFREVRNRTGIVESLFGLGVTMRAQGRYDEAEAFYKEGLTVAQKMGYLWRVSACLGGLGGLARDCERFERAARLLGAAQKIGERRGDAWGRGIILTNPLSLDEEVAALRGQ